MSNIDIIGLSACLQIKDWTRARRKCCVYAPSVGGNLEPLDNFLLKSVHLASEGSGDEEWSTESNPFDASIDNDDMDDPMLEVEISDLLLEVCQFLKEGRA